MRLLEEDDDAEAEISLGASGRRGDIFDRTTGKGSG
jgi:hypothetical protein